MSMKFVTSIDLNHSELQNAKIQNLAAAPSSPVAGQIYFDTVLGYLRVYDGSAWQRAAFLNDPYARSNHTGTQTASTISDLAATVQGYRLDQFAAPTADINLNSHKVTSVTDPTNSQDAATKNYVDAAIQAKNYKDSVRLATAAALPSYTRTTNVITASGNGALSVDGIAVAASDPILVKDGASGSDNGIYIVTATGDSTHPFILTRRTDADSSGEVTSGMSMIVDAGTANGGAQFTLITANPITLNSTSLNFAKTVAAGGTTYSAGNGLTLSSTTFAVNPGNGIVADGSSTRVDPAVVARKYTALIGDGSTTAITVTHSLGNQWVTVQVFDASSNAMVQPDITLAGSNTCTVTFATAPSSNAYRVVVTG